MPVFIANRQWVAVLLAVFMAVALSACGGGGSTSAPQMPEPGPMPDPQMACEDAGGRYNADGTCTSAEDLAAEQLAMERGAISTAITAASTAVNAVNNDSTDAQVTAADTAITNAINAIAAAANVPAEEKAANTETVNALATQLSGAKMARMTAMDDAQKAADMAMAVTAAKLYAGIDPQNGATATVAAGTALLAGERAAAYNNADQPSAGTSADTRIMVGIETAAVVALSEDKKTMVADNHGWAGKRYADPAGGDSYEAVVYSNVGEPTMGKKFGGAAANDEFEYALTNGALPSNTAWVASRVALTGVTRTAGTETFKLPTPNPSGAVNILVPGSYHGVSGTYSCVPSAPANGCSAAVAAKGFTLVTTGGDAWTFTPTDANARVTDTPDAAYASYGWWIHKTENGKTFIASAFTDEKGTVDAASGLDTLQGTATYMGGAAGKYALSSSTGGTNDAGHFTAKATLEADFSDNSVTGTIDNFMGADGETRDWSVELKKNTIGATGPISSDGTAAADGAKTVWTIGGTAAGAAGGWTGALRDNGTDGVPKVATGTFYSEFETAGKMVGAFGVNKQ